jgi:protein ImuA
MSREARLAAAKAVMAAALGGGAADRGVLPLGDVRLDDKLPGGGLPLGRWHEAAGAGLDLETGAAAGAFVAALAAPLAGRGAVVWIARRDDLHAPGLAGLGFPARRLIQVRARDEVQVLAALEDALGSEGVAAAVAETQGVDAQAGRRLQLACEKYGATGFVLRRRPFGGPPARRGGGESGRIVGSAATTRWSVAPAPSLPAPGEMGLSAPRWRVALERCRGGRLGAWIVEGPSGDGNDETHPLRVVAELGDGQLATAQPWRLAG